MGGSSGKRKKQYVDCPMGKSKTCLINGPRHSSDKCKVLGDFGAKYAKGNPTKDHGNHPIPREKLTGSWKKNAIINNVVGEILLNET